MLPMTVKNQHSAAEEQHLRRSLSNRHIQLIAISGAIGTGLFMGSGKSISTAGPSIVVAYLVIGAMLFFVMRAMGELLLHNLQWKSFQDFAADLLGPWAGFFLGWTYWLCWVVTGMADVIAITSYWSFWTHDRAWAFILTATTLLLLLALNLLTVKLFGELEFWFALIKIVAILTLIAVAIVLIVMGFTSASGYKASVSNLWSYGGFAPRGWSGFFGGFQIAVFAYVGIELVGTTSAETANPPKTMPKAINAVPVRVLVFYVAALLAMMCVTPWNLIQTDSSPFVQMFGLIGFTAAAGIMNFVVLTSAASSANRRLLNVSHALRPSPQGHGAPRVRQAIPPRCPRLGTVLHHHPHRIGPHPRRERLGHGSIHTRYDGVGGAVRLRMEHDPHQPYRPRTTQPSSSCQVDLSDARRQFHAVGRTRFLRLCHCPSHWS